MASSKVLQPVNKQQRPKNVPPPGKNEDNERLVYGWRKIMENITRGYGHHEWPKATSDKSIIFTSDDHNHK